MVYNPPAKTRQRSSQKPAATTPDGEINEQKAGDVQWLRGKCPEGNQV